VNANAIKLATARNEGARWRGSVLATSEAGEDSGGGGQRNPPSAAKGALCGRFRAQTPVFVRVVAFAFLTPFFFIKGGLNVSLGAVLANLGLLAVLVAAEMVNTGLTFGTISSLYGLNAGFINRKQFSLLVTVVLLSAVVPTELAERWFLPDADQERHVELRHPPLPAEEYACF
jgi:hypothetical protein